MKFQLESLVSDERSVYICGNFNGWNPKDPRYVLSRKSENTFEIQIPDRILPEKVEYKFTKGGWENVELDRFGSFTRNRIRSKKEGEKKDLVEMWRLNWGPFKEEFFPEVQLISENFYIPQLDRTRKVWILLPYNYHESSELYPVLYLQDAQNLFNEDSKYGNWEIDKKLALLAEYGRGNLIVVAVEHGQEERINEFIFDNNTVAKNSEGKKYIRFMADTLKPYIDANYRTKKEREHTGIGGSSLGALISLYSGFLYPEVFSKLLIFSPSLWVEPGYNFPLFSFRVPFQTKVYLYGGELEGSGMVRRIRTFEKKMRNWEAKKLFDFEFKTSINPEGTHHEFYWSQEFPKAVEWLYYDQKENPADLNTPQLNPSNNESPI